MPIDGARLERRLDELYAIGAEPDGGTFRPLDGEAWVAAGQLVERWMKDAGLETRRDAVGNLWGRVGGSGTAIVTGSHIDTVRHGGRLDGALRSEEHTSELQSRQYIVCRLLLEKKK